jgi:multidrug efflux pump subunit AcrA (membrane-fusion protein)
MDNGTIAEHIVADAILAPRAQAAITPKIAAPVRKFYVQRGAHVKAGQLLAELESKDLAAAEMDNKGAFMAAEAAYATATKAQLPEDALKAESDLAQARANLDLNKSIVKSRTQLFAEGAIAGRDLDTAQAALVQAQAAYDAAAKHLDSMHNVSHDAALKSAQGQLASAEGKYKGAAALAGYARILSPIDGVVTDRPFYEGETPAQGAPLLIVMDTSVLLAKCHIAQSQAQRLKIGAEGQVSIPGVAEPVPAKIVLISPALDAGSTTVELWLRIENKSGALKAGTPARVSIVARTEAKAWTVPVKAIVSNPDGTKSVFVVTEKATAHRKPVTLGIEDGGDVQILSGLAPADNVIVGNAYGLEESAKVKVGPAEDDDEKPAADKPAAGAGEKE